MAGALCSSAGRARHRPNPLRQLQRKLGQTNGAGQAASSLCGGKSTHREPQGRPQRHRTNAGRRLDHAHDPDGLRWWGIKTIDSIVSPKGQTKLQTKGFAGASSREVSRPSVRRMIAGGGRPLPPSPFDFHPSIASIPPCLRKRSYPMSRLRKALALVLQFRLNPHIPAKTAVQQADVLVLADVPANAEISPPSGPIRDATLVLATELTEVFHDRLRESSGTPAANNPIDTPARSCSIRGEHDAGQLHLDWRRTQLHDLALCAGGDAQV